MLNNLKLLKSIVELLNKSSSNPGNLPDSICELLVQELEIQAAVIFRVTESSNFTCIGKSDSSKKSYLQNGLYNCAFCKQVSGPDKKIALHSDQNCQIKASDFDLHEACFFITAKQNSKFLIKIAQKNPFTPTEKDGIQIIGNFLEYILSAWIDDSYTGKTDINKILFDISNELRTPTNSIVGFTSLLSDDKLSSKQVDYVLSLRDNAQNLLGLINDLIDITKVESNLITNNKILISSKSFFEEILNQFDDHKKYNLEYVIENSIPDNFYFDGAKLRYIVQNFLAYFVSISEGGKIQIKISAPKGNQIKIQILNSSIVVPSSRIKDLFTPNTLIDLGNQRINKLSVLGLHLAKKYLDLLNCELDLMSAIGKGTVLNINLTVQEFSAIENQLSALPKPGIKNKVLVIEDDYATSKLLMNYLNKWGYQPSNVTSGEKALALLEKEQFLAIITDIVLPDINGLELLKKIREIKSAKNTPIIVCSVEAEQQKAFLMGAVEYFVKPIKYKDLVEVLTSYRLKKDSNILCVDDDVPTLHLIKSAIDSVGYNSIAEAHSSKVMDLIKNIDLDLAIIDLEMPEINGIELIKLIKSNPRFANLPIIIYTGKENFEHDLKGIDGLFTELLSKRSKNIEDLAETINKMINRYETPTLPEDAAKSQEGFKILLVEDYKHSQIIVTRLLKKNNFTSVVVVENGAEAVDQVKKQKYDLILMDMQMPVMNGFEATERIRQIPDYKTTPIIALTAFAMKGDREKCLEAGATDYIPKPIDSHEFIEKVKFYTNQNTN
ncbi:MAG: hypothetical protein C0425_06695 [Chlorobiaceae bacterium]|nr:hypothetical protein [Chlorobiaceae bacterium]